MKRIAAVLLGCLPFLAVEIGLRVFGDHSAVDSAIDEDPYADLHQLQPLFVLDEQSQKWQIPQTRYNFFRPASFPAEKAANTRRVFVLGGSTVQGRPYATETAFSAWLKLRLQSADPDRDYEVINCGGVSYASYRIAKILSEIITHEPDAIVLYTGHNEFLEDRSYAHVRDLGRAERIATALAGRLHTIRWIKSFSTPPAKPEFSTEVDARLDHPGGLASYQRDPTWRTAVQEHFASTLTQIVSSAQQANVPLIMCVPTSDIVNTPPFKVETSPALSPARSSAFEIAWKRANQKQIIDRERIETLKMCLSMDGEHAGAHYALGRMLLASGETEVARTHLIAARDHDVCPLRATTQIIETVRQVAREHSVRLVDTERLFDRRSVSGGAASDQIPDPQRFVDHLHPSIAGHQEIAKEIATHFEQLDWFASDSQNQAAYNQAAKLHLGSLGEDYFARGKQRLDGLRLWASGRAGESANHSP